MLVGTDEGYIYKANPLTGALSSFISGQTPGHFCFDASNNFYFPNVATNAIAKVTPLGVVSVYSTAFSTPTACAVRDGFFYVSQNTAATIARMDMATGIINSTWATLTTGAAPQGQYERNSMNTRTSSK